jgi:superfamily II DNA/RNA helicase
LSDIPESDVEQNAVPPATTQDSDIHQATAQAETEPADEAVVGVSPALTAEGEAGAAGDSAEAAVGDVGPEADAGLEMGAQEPVEEDGFGPLGLSEPILRALHDKGYLRPTPIQAQAIPAVLMGRDVLGTAQTGTGKTASFTLPMLDILSGSRARARMPRSLILEPTRELALQVAENFVQYGKYLRLNHALLIGGESMSDQKDALTKGVDVLIATPGRLIDLFERGGLLLTDVRVLVIDEADRMLDMGFIPDIERIVGLLPRTRQTLFFSATMAPEIRRLADAFLNSPKEITVAKPASVATTITAGLVLVNEHDKREALRRLIRAEDVQNALIFCNRKRDVDILLKSLLKHGFSAGALHGDLPQSVRFATLEKFKAGELRLLVCSDVAARGIDIGGLSHVFNFDVPHHAEDYVHRIGRTGRAGKEGRAYTIATPDDRLAVETVEKLIAAPIPRVEIPGLDVVEWAEGDGRRGRHRGRGKPVKPGRGDKPQEETRDRGARPARDQRRDEPQRDREDTRRRERDRDRGDRGDRNDGPPVRGFGNEIPAFMLIRRRGPLKAILDQPVDEEDVTVDPDDGTDMAA